ncbi:hypothetical protein BSPP4475_03755 [Brevibacillus aydinogluensis]|uniref:Uncharacterized protein n=1 Tax=Brevibacillus aydinogluensis TaxID=927786 RepID=A0AA48M8C4_9BACL|nr:hypothetical protein BSPP4475_03755 [Brevibacillus aydinogluensis]
MQPYPSAQSVNFPYESRSQVHHREDLAAPVFWRRRRQHPHFDVIIPFVFPFGGFYPYYYPFYPPYPYPFYPFYPF